MPADEGAIQVCGIHVDLNQMRAGEALTPEESCHTSAYNGIEARKERMADSQFADGQVPRDGWLCDLTLCLEK